MNENIHKYHQLKANFSTRNIHQPHVVKIQYIVEKIKNNLSNLQAENDPKFKKRAGWPKNLVSYKKKRLSK